MVEQYQNLIIGSGEAGKVLAWNLAKRGEKTVVIERSMIGGSCPNVACLPSKNVIFSAKAISLLDPERGLGISSVAPKVDMAGVFRRKRKMVDGLIATHLAKFKDSGAELVMGEAKFVSPRTVDVVLNDGGTRQIRGERVILCLGSRATIPNVAGLADAKPLTHVEALNLERLPGHLVVIGGGYVGLEFAQAMRRFGSRVTIIQRGEQLLDKEDADVAEALEKVMREEGIDVLLGAELQSVEGRSGEKAKLRIRVGGSEKSVDATDILVATGRTPNSDRIDLAKTDVRLDSRGFIQVNERLQTSAPNIWAVGDCAGSPLFTHVGFDDFRIVMDNLNGGQRTTTGRVIPYCLFTDPELAHIGLTENEAKAKGISYRLAKIPMEAVLRARTLAHTRGFAKALIGADDEILGFTALGPDTSEMLAAVQTAMVAALPYTALRDAIFTHPTLAEGLNVLFSAVPKSAAAK
jgi:pyruvate/2-oxoglutarate dehydrogenase complex dihydrolipoamide dehydrogenase (E3) component